MIHSLPEDFYTDYGSAVFDPEAQTRRMFAKVPDSQITPWDDDYSDPDYPYLPAFLVSIEKSDR